MHPLVAKNQELWDEWAEINYRSAFYDVEGFKATRGSLDADVLAGVGDLTGKSVLHLQCHFGMDTLRLAMLAREAVGVDFSTGAIAKARALARELGIAAEFVESDLYALALERQFDVVFTSYGVLGWLPDLAAWGRIVARHLAPGGRFFIIEGHPTMWMFDGEAGALTLRYPYFHTPDPIVLPPAAGGGNYADPTATTTKTEYSWPHDLGETVNALVNAGLRIDELREYRHTVWKAFPFMIEDGNRFVLPPELPQLPLMFSIRASRP
jgi:SAM-dependent methyltransferase